MMKHKLIKLIALIIIAAFTFQPFDEVYCVRNQETWGGQAGCISSCKFYSLRALALAERENSPARQAEPSSSQSEITPEQVENILVFYRSRDPNSISLETLEKVTQSLNFDMAAQLKFLVPFMMPPEGKSHAIKWAHKKMFDLVENKFLQIGSRDKKIQVLRELLEYAAALNPLADMAVREFFTNISARGAIYNEPPAQAAALIVDTIRAKDEGEKKQTMYIELTRGMSLAELKAIAEFGWLANVADYSILADAQSAAAYQRKNVWQARSFEKREVVLKIRAPRYLVKSACRPYGDWGLRHFRDTSETVTEEYVAYLTKMRDEAQLYLNEHMTEHVARRETFKAEFKLKHNGKSPIGGALKEFEERIENARVVDAEQTVNNVTRLIPAIQTWIDGVEEIGKLEIDNIDWDETLETNRANFGDVEARRFTEDIEPVLQRARALLKKKASEGLGYLAIEPGIFFDLKRNLSLNQI
jgi:hypothetical protein